MTSISKNVYTDNLDDIFKAAVTDMRYFARSTLLRSLVRLDMPNVLKLEHHFLKRGNYSQ